MRRRARRLPPRPARRTSSTPRHEQPTSPARAVPRRPLARVRHRRAGVPDRPLRSRRTRALPAHGVLRVVRRRPLVGLAQHQDRGRAGRDRARVPEAPRLQPAALLMDVLHNLAFGFEHALTWQNLLFCAIGCVVGTLVGLLPGLGPLATISILLPLTYSIPTGGALIMLAGIYYGAQYGDSVSAITMKIPHASSIVACIDGYQMTLNGKCGLALFTAGVSSFIGGTVAIVVLAFFAPMLGEVAFLFGPADYCALMLVGFVCVSFVTTGSLLNGMAMCAIGVLLGQIGTDVNSGAQRYTMDFPFLAEGIGLVSVALGCFGIAEITKNLDNKDERTPFNGKIKLMPTWPEFKRIIPSALRGSVIGSFLGILPGGGPTIAQFAAYAIDKKVSKYKDEIGTGCIEGVAGQAAADEAAARTSFIPLMSVS